MGEKYQSKYLSRGNNTDKKGKKGGLIVLLLAVVLGVVLYFVGQKGIGSTLEATAPDSETVQDAVQTADRTVSDILQFQVEEMEGIRYEEISENNVITDIFYMVQEDYEWELFRICYGNTATGTVIGRMEINGHEVPVTVMTSNYTEINFPDRETYDRYCRSMDYLNVALDSLYASAGFATLEGSVEMETRTAELIFWAIELPVNIEWEERTENQYYAADFYGILGGERILLYTVSLGDKDVSNAIGMYAIDGGKTPVSVKTHSYDTRTVWLGEAYAAEYAALMETVNDVIQVIISDENYSADMP